MIASSVLSDVFYIELSFPYSQWDNKFMNKKCIILLDAILTKIINLVGIISPNFKRYVIFLNFGWFYRVSGLDKSLFKLMGGNFNFKCYLKSLIGIKLAFKS